MLPAGFTEALVTSGLSSPTAMEFSPIGELWALEQAGDAHLVRGDGTTHEALDLAVNSLGERGLLGIAFDANYDGTGPNADFVYLYYTSPSAGGGDLPNNRLSRFTVTGAGTLTPTLGSEVIVRDLPPNTEDTDTNHNGGAIHFGPDGKLYVAVGDHNYDTTPQSAHVSQVTNTPFGKILRLNADGTNPGDNPFDNDDPDSWEGAIWAMGLRNPYTFAFNPDSGVMFINDVGEGAWEEINLGEAGANYGWAGSTSPLWEGFENDGTPPPWANYRDPIMAYPHPPGIAITGGAFYPSNSPFGSAYGGLYFFADFGAGFIRTFDPDNPGSLATPDTSSGFATSASSPVDLKVGPDANLYYLGRSGGVIRRITFIGSYGATVVDGEHVFYNNSAFDGEQAAIDEADDSAIATDKVAYLAGDGTAEADNVTSYSKGINGIMVDLAGNHGPLTVNDFTFRMSAQNLAANNAPGTWAAAPAPVGFDVRAGAGEGGTDRVEIVWADGAIANRWLQVVVEGNDAAGGLNTNTGLAASHTFYFGNKIGDTFLLGEAGAFTTDAFDQIQARNNQGVALSPENIFDFGRNALVDATDQIIARLNQGVLIAINIAAPPGAEAAAAVDGADALAGVGSALAIEPAAKVEEPNGVISLGASQSGLASAQAAVHAHVLPVAAPRSLRALSAVYEAAEPDDELLDVLLADVIGRRASRR
jgi:glucose/arabinose dehydrogenase